jgi:hypothetical protein
MDTQNTDLRDFLRARIASNRLQAEQAGLCDQSDHATAESGQERADKLRAPVDKAKAPAARL